MRIYIYRFSFAFSMIFGLLLSNTSFAEVSISSVSGASEYNSSTPEIFGGTGGNTVGDNDASICTSGDTCNSCDGTDDTSAEGPIACNENRINDTTGDLSITITSDTAGTAMVRHETSNTSSDFGSFTDVSISAGGTATLTSDWASICADGDLVGASDCDTNDGTLQVYVGVDTDSDGAPDDTQAVTITVLSQMENLVSTSGSDGMYEFTAFPGDEKVYLIDLAAHGTFPTYSPNATTSFEKIRLYYVETNNTDCTDVGNVKNNSEYLETDLEEIGDTDDVEPEDDFFKGLTNGQTYVFKIALVDEAGNVGFFTQNSDCLDASHVATPDDVFGLLDEGANCYITTASYGSPLESKVGTFRKFRDRILRKLTWGRKFIRYYNWYSPKFAVTVQNSETFKTITQVLLWPAWVFAALSLEMGMLYALGVCLGVFLIIGSALFVLIRKWQSVS